MSETKETAKYSTVALPDGIVIGGQWPNTIIAWRHGSRRPATKPEHDLFKALEKEHLKVVKAIELLKWLHDNCLVPDITAHDAMETCKICRLKSELEES
jgi:hypothetical protein